MADRLIQIEKQYARLPSFTCKDGCTKCCGPVPFTESEWARLTPEEQARPVPPWRCQFVSETGCTIYDRRPLICRMFGAVDAPKMTCPEGCAPTNKLTDRQGATMMRHYLKEPLAYDPLVDLRWAKEMLDGMPSV